MIKLSALLTPLPCAVIFCLANAFKPAVIDDLAYVWYARQIVQTPAQPFGPPPDGFTLIWYDRGQAAFTLLTPMVEPYWLAIGLALFGENLVLLKLWLFPFCLLFTASLYALLGRFAPGWQRPLLAMTALSPAFLPSLNLMVDVPAVALGLSALACLAQALDPPRPRWGFVVLAGLLAGLAAQTKYTGLTTVAVLVLYGAMRRRWTAAFASALIAVALFAGWEAYLTHVYGRSHFRLQLEQRRVKPAAAAEVAPSIAGEVLATIGRKAALAVPLVGILGGVAVALIPLMILGLRGNRRFALFATAFLALEFLLMAALPESVAVFYRHPRNIRDEVSISTIVVGINGVLFIALLTIVVAYLGFRGWSRRRVRLRPNFGSWFLIGWLLLELTAYFVLSPFAAARRVLGIVTVSTLLAGRLLAFTSPADERRRLVGVLCGFGFGLGVLFAWTDYRDAVAEKRALLDSVEWIRAQPGGDRPIWFCGHWGFHYYGERSGLRPVYPNESVLEEGDWVIYPDTLLRPYAQLIFLEPEWAEKMVVIEWYDAWPLRTNPEFYDGYQPIRRHEGHRLRVTIFRVKKKFLARPT